MNEGKTLYERPAEGAEPGEVSSAESSLLGNYHSLRLGQYNATRMKVG